MSAHIGCGAFDFSAARREFSATHASGSHRYSPFGRGCSDLHGLAATLRRRRSRHGRRRLGPWRAVLGTRSGQHAHPHHRHPWRAVLCDQHGADHADAWNQATHIDPCSRAACDSAGRARCAANTSGVAERPRANRHSASGGRARGCTRTRTRSCFTASTLTRDGTSSCARRSARRTWPRSDTCRPWPRGDTRYTWARRVPCGTRPWRSSTGSLTGFKKQFTHFDGNSA
jgi:hypothetical protein